ncbi:MAG TPA: hypothetical protein VMZ69_03450, partial [Saprospiraceae bacterium]|nr:hypothetical protein [Saprospiraceae bacterium]
MAKAIKKVSKKEVNAGTFLGFPIEGLGPLLALLGALIYFQTVSFDYTQDDAIVISENMFTTKGISG